MAVDINSLFKITYGLYVVSSEYDKGMSGCVINTLMQVTAEPPNLSITISKENYTNELIANSGLFSAVVLSQNATLAEIGRFGFRAGRDFPKFEGIDFKRDVNAMPYPTEPIVARYACRVFDSHDIGTHCIYLASIDETEVLSNDEPLTYNYYRDVIKGKTPKNAPSFHRA